MSREGVVPSSHFLLEIDDVANTGLLPGTNRIDLRKWANPGDAHLLHIREAV